MKISIVLNGSGRKKQFQETLKSIERQTVKPYEIVAVQDESRDIPHISRTWNRGVEQAKGDVIILQNAEVKYTTDDCLFLLTAPFQNKNKISMYASCQYLDPVGNIEGWYTHPIKNPRFLNFCQALWLDDYWRIGGFDEKYIGYGCDDVDFSFRLQFSGVNRCWSEAIVQHQWHEHNVVFDADRFGDLNTERFLARKTAIESNQESFVVNENSVCSREQAKFC